MKIIEFVKAQEPMGNDLFIQNEVLYVEMTQEEYLIAAQAILNKIDKENEKCH